MDIALELVDTFVADHFYARLFPFDNLNKTDVNSSTQETVRQLATKNFHFQPSQAAYMSSLDRDNPYRQFFTLFVTGW